MEIERLRFTNDQDQEGVVVMGNGKAAAYTRDGRRLFTHTRQAIAHLEAQGYSIVEGAWS